jgi:hypothetical protein
MSASKKRTFQDLEDNFKSIHKYARYIDTDPKIDQLYQDETARLNKKLKRCKERAIHNETMRLQIVADRNDTERKIMSTALFMTNLKSTASELLRVTQGLASIAEGGDRLMAAALSQKPSRFTGVNWDKTSGKWLARGSLGGKQFHIGRFEDEVEAAKAYDAKARSLRGAATKTNFNLDGSECCNNKKKKEDTSKFMGVCWNKKQCKWVAQIYHEGKTQGIGSFTDEVEAAKAWDAKARSLRGPTTTTLNFPVIVG